MKILAPAKINLFLEIVNKRRDGYHNIKTIFQTVSLYDEIFLFPNKSDKIEFSCNSTIPRFKEDNIAYKAAIKLQKYIDIHKGVGDAPMGAKIIVKKHIPPGAGLGGGSTNGAAVIRGLLRLWNKHLKTKTIEKLCLEIGADVPYLLHGGCYLAEGIGEKLTKLNPAWQNPSPLRVSPTPQGSSTFQKDPLWIILVNPKIFVPTRMVYNNLKLPRFQLDAKRKKHELKLSQIKKLSVSKLSELMFNRLEPVVTKKYPELTKIKSKLYSLGLKNVLMSGSGSTIFGICTPTGTGTKGGKKQAEEIKQKLKKYPWKTWVVKTVNHSPIFVNNL